MTRILDLRLMSIDKALTFAEQFQPNVDHTEAAKLPANALAIDW
jgi:hypothetical protein